MQRRIFQSIHPFNWFAAIYLKDAYFHVSILRRQRLFLRFAFEGRAYQYKAPPLRAIPVASCLHQGRRGSPCPAKGCCYLHSQLPRRLAHPGPVSSTVVQTQGYGAQSPQPIVGASGQPGKEQTLPYAEDLFSRHGVGLGQPHSKSLKRACSVNAEMPGVLPAQEGCYDLERFYVNKLSLYIYLISLLWCVYTCLCSSWVWLLLTSWRW